MKRKLEEWENYHNFHRPRVSLQDKVSYKVLREYMESHERESAEV